MSKAAKFKLGARARDIVTGFEGIITGHARYLTGCDQFVLSAQSKDNKPADGAWFDENRLEQVGTYVLELPGAAVAPGCDMTAPIK